MQIAAGVAARYHPRFGRLSSKIVFLKEPLNEPGVGSTRIFEEVAYPDMTTSPLFPGFDGLMTLSRREGVDIRPTLLRVLTDLYVQASTHSADEARQFVELTSRLIDQVDDATRAAVRARLAIYPATPDEIMRKLGLRPVPADRPLPLPEEIASAPPAVSPTPSLAEAQTRMSSNLAMQPADAAQICE